MNLKTCKFYKMKRKRDLYCLLKINGETEYKQISNLYSPYIAQKSKKRLIEPVISEKLKKVQKSIQILLKDIEFDDNVFSGISGKSYIDNGKLHIGCKCVVALDISKFFPNTSREKVYSFFKNDLLTSSDVAKILTDLCTIDIEKICDINKGVLEYMKENKIKYTKHIPTGSPISCILSYLANYNMFNRITELVNKYDCKTSIYVDDIVISSKNKINKQLINEVIAIIRNSGYKIQKKKLKHYNHNEFKRITGNIISKDGKNLVIPNKIRHKIYKLKKDKDIEINNKINRMRGFNQVIKQIEKANNKS